MEKYSEVIKLLSKNIQDLDKRIAILNEKQTVKDNLKEIKDIETKMQDLVNSIRKAKSNKEIDNIDFEYQKLSSKRDRLYKEATKPLDLKKIDKAFDEIYFLKGEKEELESILIRYQFRKCKVI